MDDGYIKFTCKWDKNTYLLVDADIENINFYRSKLLELKMVGKVPNGPGFGNISYR